MKKFSEHNFSGKKVLIRVDFNVPIDKKNQITDDTRIKSALPTIQKVLNDGGSVVLMSHWGRPIKDMAKDENLTQKDFSLKRIQKHLSDLLHKNVEFADDCIGEEVEMKAKNLQPGSILLIENLRLHEEEEKGDKAFAKSLSKLGDFYINDAFGTAHRAHASTSVIATYFEKNNKSFGQLMENEMEAADKILKKSENPFTAIIGGAKVSDKILIIENLLERATDIIIGGGMAYTFFKAKGGKIGNSLCENDRLDTALELLEKAKAKQVNIHLPKDSIIADRFSNVAATKEMNNDEIPEGWMGLDIGPKAIQEFTQVIQNSKTILWNGPMGVFEMEKFQAGTKAIADAVKSATSKGAYSLVGGGDSVAAVNKFGYQNNVSYVSTGGGALLEYFEGKELPGISTMSS